jgi:glycogen debranching enzyme
MTPLGKAPGHPIGPGFPHYYIAAQEKGPERRSRVLKQGDTFAVFDDRGDISSAALLHEGLFHRDTRYLSRLELFINGHRPLLLSSGVRADNALLTADFVNPDLYREEQHILSREMIHVARSIFLWDGTCYQHIEIRNFDTRPHEVHVTLGFDGDFADLFEVRGMRRAHRGELRSSNGDDEVRFDYRGLDRIERRTTLKFAPAPDFLTEGYATFRFDVSARDRHVVSMTASCNRQPAGETDRFGPALRQARRALHQVRRRACHVHTSSELVNEILKRSVADVSMLLTRTAEGPYPYAGIPWFSTAFGRDGIITALQMLWVDPEIAKGVLKFLAAHQAREERPEADAEPGKILHEIRSGEMANLGEVPFGRYYGSIDATPLFVLLAARYFARTGDRETIKEIWQSVEKALHWIDRYGDLDGDGFIEYARRTEQGLTNQGWKDSHDAVPHADGKLARGPIALVEVQGYVYAAKRELASAARALGHEASASRLESEAEMLRERFESAFWCEELGTYALALDGDKRPCAVRTSNAGHALFTGIVNPDRAPRVAETLLSRGSYSGWGVRTMAMWECRYNPVSYHNGTIWPHDNSLIALGLARYGLKAGALRIMKGLFQAAEHFDLFRLPELFCGFSRRKGRQPVLYPVACAPQAWASATPFALLEACLGLRCDYAARTIWLDHPVLPPNIEHVDLRGLALGDARVDLSLYRHSGDIALNVVRQQGEAKVKVVKVA